MADIRCSSCGKDNPDFLDVCQFCQSPLKPESMVHTGENPTKKNTGELEPILPQWLKDMRQQARDSAEEDAVQAAAQPKVQKNETPDLLAGLASQSSDEQEEIPDWLASIGPKTKPKSSAPSSPESPTDFFAQFNKSESAPPAASKISEPAQEEPPSWMGGPAQAQVPAEKDELSEWLSRASEEPSEPTGIQPGVPKEPPAPEEKEDLSWLHDLEASAKQTGELSAQKQDAGWNFEAPSTPSQPAPQSPAPQEDLSWPNDLGGTSESAQQAATLSSDSQDDMSWLNNLGGVSEPQKQTPAQPSTPQEDLSWLNNLGGTSEPSKQPSASQEDMSWLDNLGGAVPPVQPTSTPSASQEDLDWLNKLGGVSEPAGSESTQPSTQDDLDWLKNFAESSAPTQQESTQAQDLGWLDKLGGTPEPSQPAPAQPSSSQEDLDWLSNLGTSAEPSQPEVAQPSSQQDDLSWLNDLGGTSESSKSAFARPFGSTDELTPPKTFDEEQGVPHISPFTPRRTAPLGGDIANDNIPDWLKSATEESPSLPLGTSALDQMREPYQSPASHKTGDEGARPSKSEPDSYESDVFSSASESQSLSNQDVDSLFSVQMPDWLSRPESGASDATSQQAETAFAGGDESLAPVDLPSWVQAMRPVESVLSETPSIENQPTEKEGPLAGLRGVIPIAPIGSSRRPKAFSLKLQATDEQQTSAALLEKILDGETAPRAMVSPSYFMPQRVLRWTITGLLFIVLGAVIALRSQLIPVSAALPPDAIAAENAIAAIPENSSVLVVVDYEPSLAGEMEAVGGPLLNHLVLQHSPRLVFLSTSPNSSALVERLMTNTRINKPPPDGPGYNAGEQYCNLGYLPGGSTGILGFVEAPDQVIPSACGEANVTSFSDYSAVVVLTDNTESGRVWVEQLDAAKQADPSLATHPLILATSAQAGPLLQPYVSSRQVTGMISGLSDAVRYEYKNAVPPGIARTYWDAFGVGIMMTIAVIFIGSMWSLMTGIRARRTNGEQG